MRKSQGREDAGPNVLVYTGLGSSHSWLWFADSMENLGLLDLRFGTADAFQRKIEADVVVLSGGDAFRMAEELGPKGFHALERFVRDGGTYLGICAGAYLPLHSRSFPQPKFDLVRARVANIAPLEAAKMLPPKYFVKCGNRVVYQPLRGTVTISTSFGLLPAPLYGGPCWLGSEDAQIIARYSSIARDASLIVPREQAEAAVVGKVAGLYKDLGKGKLILLGPHAEHPQYPDANRWLIGMLPDGHVKAPMVDQAGLVPLEKMKRALSNARVASMGLQGAQWRIGSKVWEWEKVGLFLDAMWRRMPLLEKMHARAPERVSEELAKALNSMKRLRSQEEEEASRTASEMFISLSDATSAFLGYYFDALRSRTG